MMLSDVCLSVDCLSDVCRVRSTGGVCGRPAEWCILADRARYGRPGSRLPLPASVAGLGGGISWRPPTYNLFVERFTNMDKITVNVQVKMYQSVTGVVKRLCILIGHYGAIQILYYLL